MTTAHTGGQIPPRRLDPGKVTGPKAVLARMSGAESAPAVRDATASYLVTNVSGVPIACRVAVGAWTISSSAFQASASNPIVVSIEKPV